MKSLARTPEWQRQRALILHREFKALEVAVAAGASTDREIEAISEKLRDQTIEWSDTRGRIKSKRLAASPATLYRALSSWREGGRSYTALLLGYQSAGHHRPVPDELDHEIRRLATLATGGRNKAGLAPATFAAHDLKRRWRAGESIPGLGTWQEWWMANPDTASMPLPDVVPDFPYSDKTITNHVGSPALRRWGNVGFAAAKKDLPIIERDYSQLRKAEMFTLDDVRLDLTAVNEFTKQTVNVEAYIMMEVGSRMIVSFIIRDKGKIKARDVRALIGAGLSVTGLPKDYTTHILFERGTVACAPELEEFLEGVSEGRIQVRRTGLLENVRWVGAGADRARGNSAGKAVIESFHRSLHTRLLHLPGQRGNTWENQPHNLGIEDRDRLKGQGENKGRIDRPRRASTVDGARDSLVAYTERLCRVKRTAEIHGIDCDFEIPLLTTAQLEAEVQMAIDAHNREPGHAYQGHHQRALVRGPGGTWTPLNNVPIS